MAEAAGQRLQQLLKMLEREPNDAFVLYGIALEYKKSNELSHAIEYLDRVLRVDPGYCYAYFQKGQIQEARGDVEGAKRTYQDGISAAKQKGDDHAQAELEGALQMIE